MLQSNGVSNDTGIPRIVRLLISTKLLKMPPSSTVSFEIFVKKVDFENFSAFFLLFSP